MKRVSKFSTKIVRKDNDVMIYQKDDENPEIPVYAANVARANLARGFSRDLSNETDDLPTDIAVNNTRLMPVVCAPEALSGGLLAGYIDIEQDNLILCEHPIFDASKAARCAHQMANEMGIDDYDLVFGTQTAA
tara:strand:+ start:3285 stop:3686 length:402 start_codon:yes stop_codon:yes gene_type:complete